MCACVCGGSKSIVNSDNRKELRGKLKSKNNKKGNGLANYRDIRKGITMEYGERNFRLISVNMDDFRNYETKETDIRTDQRKADFVCIQETHNTKDIEIKCGNYMISSEAENGNSVNKGTGGVAIMVGNNLVNTIKNVKEFVAEI